MRSRAAVFGWIPAAGLALALTGCSGGPPGGVTGLPSSDYAGPVVPTTIGFALGDVAATSWDTDYVEFGDVAKVVALNGGSGQGPLVEYVGVGQSGYAQDLADPKATLGFDPFGVQAALTVGNLPHQVTFVYGGFNPTSVGAVLGKEGFKLRGTVDGAALWGYGTDGQMNPNNPTGLPSLDDMLVSGRRIGLGDAGADLKALAGSPNPPLYSHDGMGAVAQCLGSALAAVITPRTSAAKAPLLGIGLLADTAQDASEEVCVTASSASSAETISAQWTSAVATGHSTRLDEAWSKLLTDPQAATLAPVDGAITVRLTAKPAAGARVGTVLATFFSASADLDGLIGPS